MNNSRLLGIASLLFLLLQESAGLTHGWAVLMIYGNEGNWLDGTAPTTSDSVTFNAGDTGVVSILLIPIFRIPLIRSR